MSDVTLPVRKYAVVDFRGRFFARGGGKNGLLAAAELSDEPPKDLLTSSVVEVLVYPDGRREIVAPPTAPPTDADVEHARRAMVDAHQTMLALLAASRLDRSLLHPAVEKRFMGNLTDAAAAFLAADSARGGA